MKEKLIKWLAGLLGSGIMILLLFGTFAVVALVGGNVMRLFGFRYDSVGQLLLYFLLGELIGLPLDLISTALPKVLYRMGKLWFRAGIVMLPLSLLAMLPALGKDTQVLGIWLMGVVLVQVVVMIATIFPVEKALKRKFDKFGRRIG